MRFARALPKPTFLPGFLTDWGCVHDALEFPMRSRFGAGAKSSPGQGPRDSTPQIVGPVGDEAGQS
eukprot:10243871-Alexandrium_andersonii.AAC.1